MELKNFLNLSQNDAVTLDFKNIFFDELYAENYDGSTSLDNWLKYYSEAKVKNIDCDVSKLSVEIWQHILRRKIDINTELVNQTGSKNKFQLRLNSGKFLRLDSGNSMWTTFKQALLAELKFDQTSRLKVYKELNIEGNKALSGQSKKIIRNVSLFIKDQVLLNNLNEFATLTHSIGNFMIYPFSSKNYNTSRGTSHEIRDYLDLTLLCIYYWYTDQLKETPLKSVLDCNSEWFDRFGTGNIGWNNFVEKNYFEDFVIKRNGEFFEPIMFWPGHAFNDAAIEKSNGNVLTKPELVNRINAYLEFVNHGIKARGKRIFADLTID